MGFSIEGEVPRGDKETGDVPTSAVLRFVVSGSVVTFDDPVWWWWSLCYTQPSAHL